MSLSIYDFLIEFFCDTSVLKLYFKALMVTLCNYIHSLDLSWLF